MPALAAVSRILALGPTRMGTMMPSFAASTAPLQRALLAWMRHRAVGRRDRLAALDQHLVVVVVLEMQLGQLDRRAPELLRGGHDGGGAGQHVLAVLVHTVAVEDDHSAFGALLPGRHGHGDPVVGVHRRGKAEVLRDIDRSSTGQAVAEQVGDEPGREHAVGDDPLRLAALAKSSSRCVGFASPDTRGVQLDVASGDGPLERGALAWLDLIESAVLDHQRLVHVLSPASPATRCGSVGLRGRDRRCRAGRSVAERGRNVPQSKLACVGRRQLCQRLHQLRTVIAWVVDRPADFPGSELGVRDRGEQRLEELGVLELRVEPQDRGWPRAGSPACGGGSGAGAAKRRWSGSCSCRAASRRRGGCGARGRRRRKARRKRGRRRKAAMGLKRPSAIRRTRSPGSGSAPFGSCRGTSASRPRISDAGVDLAAGIVGLLHPRAEQTPAGECGLRARPRPCARSRSGGPA